MWISCACCAVASYNVHSSTHWLMYGVRCLLIHQPHAVLSISCRPLPLPVPMHVSHVHSAAAAVLPINLSITHRARRRLIPQPPYPMLHFLTRSLSPSILLPSLSRSLLLPTPPHPSLLFPHHSNALHKLQAVVPPAWLSAAGAGAHSLTDIVSLIESAADYIQALQVGGALVLWIMG